MFAADDHPASAHQWCCHEAEDLHNRFDQDFVFPAAKLSQWTGVHSNEPEGPPLLKHRRVRLRLNAMHMQDVDALLACMLAAQLLWKGLHQCHDWAGDPLAGRSTRQMPMHSF